MCRMNYTLSAVVAHNLSANRDRLASLLATANEYAICSIEAEQRINAIGKLDGTHYQVCALQSTANDMYRKAIFSLRMAASVASLVRAAEYQFGQ